MMGLATKIGKSKAHHLVYNAASIAFENKLEKFIFSTLSSVEKGLIDLSSMNY